MVHAGETYNVTQDAADGVLPEQVARHLRLAAQAYHQDEIAEAHLWSAHAIAPAHATVLIGLYRFYFYKNRLHEALGIARLCLTKAASDNELPLNWREVRRADASFSDYAASLPRFYLFTLKAYAYLSLRLGDHDEGHTALAKLLELDPTDKIGAKTLIGVLDRMGCDGDT